MAPESGERTSTPRRTSTPQRKHSAPPIKGGSRPLLSRKKPKKQKKNTESGELYKVKTLLKEEKRNGTTWYLVDWEDAQDETSYKPTWEPEENITRPAIAEWEERKRERKEGTERAGKRKRSSTTSNLDQRTPRKPRRDQSRETVTFQTAPPKAREIPDSYEQEQDHISHPQHERPQFQVEIPELSESFDREAYLRAASSQPSTYLSSSQPSLETPAAVQRRQQYHTDISDAVIPDSQDIPESSNYRPSETVTSKPTSSLQNTQTNTGGERESTQIENTQAGTSQDEIEDSGKIHSSQNTVPPSSVSPCRIQLDQGSRTYCSQYDNQSLGVGSSLPEQHFTYRSPYARSVPEESQQGNSRPTSSGRSVEDRGVFITPSPRTSRTPSELPVDTPSQEFHARQQQPPVGFQISAISSVPVIAESSGVGVLSSQFGISSTSQSRSGQTLGSLARILNLSPETDREQPHVLNQEISQSEVDLGFQTQIPLSSGDSCQQESRGALKDHVQISPRSTSINRSARDRHSSVPVQETGSRTQASILRQSQSQPRESSSFESTWQAAQVVSPLPRISTQISTQEQDSPRPTPAVVSQQTDFPSSNSQPPENDQSQKASESNLSLKISGQVQASVIEQVIESIEPVSSLHLSRPQLSPDSDNSNFPSALSSPLHNNMDSRGIPSAPEPRLSIKEQIERARQKAREEAMQAKRTASLSDNEIPANLSQPHAPLSQLSLREPALSSLEVEASLLPIKSLETSSDKNDAQIHPLGEKEYIVPLPMVAWVRDEYKRLVRSYNREIKTFLGNVEIDQILVDKMDKMIIQLKGLSSHTILVEEETSTQADMTLKMQAMFAEECSTKCLFLRELLTALQPFRLHVAVIARTGRMLDILEAICKFNEYDYTRPDRNTSLENVSEGSLKVTLLPVEDYLQYAPVKRLECVIAFDEDFTREQLHRLQGNEGMEQFFREGLLLISLKVANSVEHLDLCIPKDAGELDRKTMLINCIESTFEEVGLLDQNKYPHLVESAKAVASFVKDHPNNDPEWPLPAMPFIDGIEEYLTLSQPVSGSPTQSCNTTSQAPTPIPGFKRPLSVEERTKSDSPKRQRLTPNSEVRDSPTCSSHNNIAIGDASQVKTTIEAETQDVVAKTNSADAEQAAQMESLLAKVSRLELQLESRVATENKLRQRNRDLEARVRDHESSMKSILPKYQEALNDRAEYEHEKNQAVTQTATLSKRLEARTAEITKLKEEKTSLDAEVTSARTALSTSEIPEIAELGKMREEISMLKAENEKLKKKLESSHNENDYMRSNYQQASNKASETFQELTALKGENETLQRKASENLVRIHEINQRSESAQLVQRISELETILRERGKDLERKTEELRIRMNSRRDTRGASAPRSPRMGNGTMSPRPVERIIGTARSRGSSPAPGTMGFSVDGGAAFRGDALFQSGPSIGRWGHHLQ